ncbi:hypothetical protein BD310DRAFT_852897, partial [Dichomitus squalens]
DRDWRTFPSLSPVLFGTAALANARRVSDRHGITQPATCGALGYGVRLSVISPSSTCHRAKPQPQVVYVGRPSRHIYRGLSRTDRPRGDLYDSASLRT